MEKPLLSYPCVVPRPEERELLCPEVVLSKQRFKTPKHKEPCTHRTCELSLLVKDELAKAAEAGRWGSEDALSCSSIFLWSPSRSCRGAGDLLGAHEGISLCSISAMGS